MDKNPTSHWQRPKQLCWEITLATPLPARRIGVVFAADERAALKSAIEQFRMHEADWPRLLARQV